MRDTNNPIKDMLKKKLYQLQSRYLNRKLVFLADFFLSMASSGLVLLLVNLLAESNMYAGRFFWTYIAIAAAVSLLLIYFTGCYKIIIRHLSVKDIVPFGVVSLCKALVLILLMPVFQQWSPILPYVAVIDFLLTFFLMLSIRIAMILAYDIFLRHERQKGKQENILIYGTTDKSVAAAIRLQNSPHYRTVGFLSKEHWAKDSRIERLPVYCMEDGQDFARLLTKSGADTLLFAKETDAQAEEDGLLKYCNEHAIRPLIIPTVDEMQQGQAILHPRNIRIEDLLGRPEIKISMDAIRENFSGKVVMVTGAAGSIGSELVRQLASFGVKRLILFDNAETPMHNLRLELEDKYKNLDFVPVIGDVRQERRLDYAFRKFRPQVVFHAAAYKHVPLMEENPCEAVLVNVEGTRLVADKCIEYGLEKMVMISTDKAVNPTNIMGCTKRLAEIYAQSLGLAIEHGQHAGKTVFVTTRFGNVLGSNGSVIPRFREQIAAGGPVTVTHPEINRFFMTIPEACRLVMEAATMATATQLFVFDMGAPVKIDTLARRMISLAGFIPDKDIKIEYTGLRPGEKLYEEVLSNAENTLPTFHDRIRIAKVREYDYNEACAAVDTLRDLSREVDIPDMVRYMKKVVPEFKSAANSRFAVYDEPEA